MIQRSTIEAGSSPRKAVPAAPPLALFVLVELDGLTVELYPDAAARPAWTGPVATRLLEVLADDDLARRVSDAGATCVLLGLAPRGLADDYAIKSFEPLGRNLGRLVADAAGSELGGAKARSLLAPPDASKGRQLDAELLLVDGRETAGSIVEAVRRGERTLVDDVTVESPAEGFRKALARVLADMPDDYAARRRSLAALSDSVRAAIASTLGPALNAQAAAMPQVTYEDKKKLAKWVNAELRRFGLALAVAGTPAPCLLTANTGGRPGIGRFAFYYTDESGRRHDVLSPTSLPELHLTLDELTRAPYGQRTGRTR